ncbi:MAG: discoidin domain-containing protein [Verrucomicrobia bacterium]|nr:discoidin domain-containing protein [Verrucomicrobiota bacterium]
MKAARALPAAFATMFALTSAPAAAVPRDEAVSAITVRQQVEEDWLKSLAQPLTTQSDAAGAVDGVKDGKYAFHTGHQANPWWQVDLGRATSIARIVVFNRLDYAPGLHNADNLRILTSDDGHNWTLRHDNKGRHFGGISGAKPLAVTFNDSELRARFVRLQLPSAKPIFFHLDEVEIYGPGPNPRNLALHQPANQSSLSQWSTAKITKSADFPTDTCIKRARNLAADLGKSGVDVAAHVRELDAAERRLRSLPANAPESERRQLYLDTRWIIRRLVFANPLLNFDQLLFVKRFTQETYPDVCLNHMPWVSRPGGDICILKNSFSPDGEGQSVRHILNGALGPGHVHGMDLWWDGSRVVFGYAKARSNEPPQGWLDRRTNYDLRRNEEPTHLFEVGVDGRRLRQLTRGEWSDLDPTYAPNGDIVFVSERCGKSLQCNEYDKDETSCNLYVMRPDGSGIRRLSANKDGDYLPHALDDGTIGYTRWEYHERSFAFIQSLWFIRPDGTGADAIFKQHFANPWALEDVRSIPRSRKLVAIATGHHTLAVGPLVIVDAAPGMNEPRGIGIVTPGVKPPEGGMDGVPVPEGGVVDNGGLYSTPWALSEKHFLVSFTHSNMQTDASGYALYLVDVFGNKELVHRDPAISCFIPLPLRARPQPPVLTDVTDATKDYATCVVSDASFGCDGIAPERIHYLRIAEPIGWPYDIRNGGQRYVEDHNCQKPTGEKRILDNWTPLRILGDVPVERDGSAHFRVPPDTAVYFQLLDENRMELRRMRSFISFQRGEQRACAGCHESRSVVPRPAPTPLAAKRPPSALIPPPWGDRAVNFLRDVQPVFDAHCVRCHSGLKPAGGLDFCGGLTSFDLAVPGYGYNRAYATIMAHGLVSCSPSRAQDATITPPLAYGSHKSKLIEALGKEPHTQRVILSAEEKLRLVMWIDANAPYHDRFINKRAPQPAYDLAADGELRASLKAIHKRRCAGCHRADEVTRLDWINIHDAKRSLFLNAPLAKCSGGAGKCDGVVYADAQDADYRAASGLVSAAVKRAWANPRRDLVSMKSDAATTGRSIAAATE